MARPRSRKRIIPISHTASQVGPMGGGHFFKVIVRYVGFRGWVVSYAPKGVIRLIHISPEVIIGFFTTNDIIRNVAFSILAAPKAKKNYIA